MMEFITLADQMTFRELPDFLISHGRYWATTDEIAAQTGA